LDQVKADRRRCAKLGSRRPQHRPGGSKVHISSIVVHVNPSHSVRLQAAIGRLAGLETHAATATGKLVVTIEAPSEDESIAAMDAVRALPGVFSVAMVFHQFEPDPEEEL
jgi:nitrate reductase NapD